MKNSVKKESGEIMLEGMIVMVITMLMLVWILGIGFLYYQKYTVRITSNDVAKKVAATYDAPTTEIVTGYITISEMRNLQLRNTEELRALNERRAHAYVKYMMDKANLFGTVKNTQTKLTCDTDGLGRSHITVTTECTFKTPFSIGLEVFGMSGDITYRVTSYADSTSLTRYTSSVMIVDTLTNGTLLGGTGFIEKTIDMVNSFIGMYNQLSK